MEGKKKEKVCEEEALLEALLLSLRNALSSYYLSLFFYARHCIPVICSCRDINRPRVVAVSLTVPSKRNARNCDDLEATKSGILLVHGVARILKACTSGKCTFDCKLDGNTEATNLVSILEIKTNIRTRALYRTRVPSFARELQFFVGILAFSSLCV